MSDEADAERYRALRPYLAKIIFGISLTEDETDKFVDEFTKKMDEKIRSRLAEVLRDRRE